MDAYNKALEKIKRDQCCKPICCIGVTGPMSLTGEVGPTGATGPAGTSGILNFADFYALMPLDNAATVAPGTDVSFPQDGLIVVQVFPE